MRSSENEKLSYLFNKFESTKTWGASAVKLAASAKQISRNLKGEALNCFVVEYSQGGNKGNDEFVNFFKSLKKSINTGNFITPTRFQLAVLSNGHWTAFDILIKDNQLNILCLDGANDGKEEHELKCILNEFPNSNAYRYQPEKLSDGHRALIQTDNHSCSRMTLEHIFLLSKLDIFERLAAENENMLMQSITNLGKVNFSDIEEQNILDTFEKYETTKESSHIKILRLKNLEQVAPKVLTTIQSWDILKTLNNQSINVQAKRHSSIVDSLNNKTIDHKKNKMYARVLNCYKELNVHQMDRIIDNHAAIRDNFISCTDAERQQLIQNQVANPSIMKIIEKEISTIEKQIIDNATIKYTHRLNKSKFENELLTLKKTNYKKDPNHKDENIIIQHEIKKSCEFIEKIDKEYPLLTDNLHQLNHFKKSVQTFIDKPRAEEKLENILDHNTIKIPLNAKKSISHFFDASKRIAISKLSQDQSKVTLEIKKIP